MKLAHAAVAFAALIYIGAVAGGLAQLAQADAPKPATDIRDELREIKAELARVYERIDTRRCRCLESVK